MKKNIYILLLIFLPIIVYSQTSEVIIEDLKPTIGDNKFPVIKYKKDLKVEDKINTLLQLENLEHLPNVFKKNPFEKVVNPEERIFSSTEFYKYNKNTTPKNILSITMSGEATGAYSEQFEIYYNFDLRTGKKIILNDFLTEIGIKEITKTLNLKVKKTIEKFLIPIKVSLKNKNSNKDDEDLYAEQMELYSECLEKIEQNTIDYYDFYFEENSITFERSRCSNHARRAIDDLDRFKLKFSYNEMEKYLSKNGEALLNGTINSLEIKSPIGKFYKGKINSKYPITTLISKIYADNSVDMQYWYDKIKTPIKWNGTLINNHFALIEYEKYDEAQGKWIIKAKIEVDIINNNLIGTWTNVETKEIFKIELTEY